MPGSTSLAPDLSPSSEICQNSLVKQEGCQEPGMRGKMDVILSFRGCSGKVFVGDVVFIT